MTTAPGPICAATRCPPSAAPTCTRASRRARPSAPRRRRPRRWNTHWWQRAPECSPTRAWTACANGSPNRTAAAGPASRCRTAPPRCTSPPWAAANCPMPPAPPPPPRAAALYVAALGSSQLRDAAGARAAAQKLDDLVRNAPDARQASDPATRRLLGLLNAEIELAAGAADAALQALQALPAGSDTGRPELLLRTRALLQARRAGEGAQALQTWVANHPKDATARQLLASVAQAQGQTLRAVWAEAEAHAARYDYAAAADRFKDGQDLARRSGAAVDHIDASIIDTRLRAMESLLREQAAER